MREKERERENAKESVRERAWTTIPIYIYAHITNEAGRKQSHCVRVLAATSSMVALPKVRGTMAGWVGSWHHIRSMMVVAVGGGGGGGSGGIQWSRWNTSSTSTSKLCVCVCKSVSY